MNSGQLLLPPRPEAAQAAATADVQRLLLAGRRADALRSPSISSHLLTKNVF